MQFTTITSSLEPVTACGLTTENGNLKLEIECWKSICERLINLTEIIWMGK